MGLDLDRLSSTEHFFPYWYMKFLQLHNVTGCIVSVQCPASWRAGNQALIPPDVMVKFILRPLVNWELIQALSSWVLHPCHHKEWSPSPPPSISFYTREKRSRKWRLSLAMFYFFLQLERYSVYLVWFCLHMFRAESSIQPCSHTYEVQTGLGSSPSIWYRNLFFKKGYPRNIFPSRNWL